MSRVEKQIVDQCIRFGHPIPDRIANKPELTNGIEIFYQAFLDLKDPALNSPISWASIAQYAEFYGFDSETTDDLFYHVREMDNAYMKKMNKND